MQKRKAAGEQATALPSFAVLFVHCDACRRWPRTPCLDPELYCLPRQVNHREREPENDRTRRQYHDGAGRSGCHWLPLRRGREGGHQTPLCPSIPPRLLTSLPSLLPLSCSSSLTLPPLPVPSLSLFPPPSSPSFISLHFLSPLPAPSLSPTVFHRLLR